MPPIDLAAVVAALRELPPPVGLAVLFGASIVEYVVPPLPGDTVVVAGAALVTAFGWPLWPVYAVCTAGSVAGSALAWAAGAAWASRPHRTVHPRGAAAVALLVERFERHGAAYLVLNRFMPGVRAFFFVAAGLAGLKLRPVLLWSGLSAAAWNALLIAVGWAVGDNLARLEALLARYTVVAGAIVAVVVGVAMVRVAAQVRRRSL